MKWIIGAVSALVIVVLLLPLFVARELTDAKVEYQQAKTLVILLHAFNHDNESLDGIKEIVLGDAAFNGADVLQPELPLNMFSMASTDEIVAQLLVEIDGAWAKRKEEGRPYENIVIVGHSLGALLARKLYVVASGENAAAPFEPELKNQVAQRGGAPLTNQREWAKQNTRIILLAGMNRGWSISHHMSLSRAVFMQMGVAMSYVLEVFYGRQPIVMEIRRGAPFITQLRLQWLAMEQAKNKKPLLVVQLLGTVDDLVSPDDNLDLVVGSRFRYLSVPYSGHANIIKVNACIDDKDKRIKTGDCDYRDARKNTLQRALMLNDIDPNEVDFASEKIRVQTDVKNVVFVIHGIRDEGHWTKQIARRIQREFKQQGKVGVVATKTSSYGYFPMLSFLVPGARQEKVEWFMDRYVEARALYPNAKFHFVGHSHGTYLLAKALKDYPSVHFDRVVFAGSVVRQQYEWDELHGKRVNAVLNYVADGDWVVAFFPKALQSLNLQDLGSAGHDGFANKTVVQPPELFIRGGHSAALNEQVWDSIAGFVVTGEFQAPPESVIAHKRSKLIAYPAYIAPLIWLVIAAALLWVLRFLFRLKIREWKKTLIILSYGFLVWTILTSV